MRRRWTIWLHPTVQPTVYQRNRSRMGVCVNAPLINISPSNPPTPPPPTTTTLTPPQRGLSDGDGERMSLSGWLSAAGPGPGHIPALWAQVGGLPLSVGLKGLAWRRAAAQQQDVPLRLSFWYKNTNLARLRQRLLTEQATESVGWGVSNANVFFFPIQTVFHASVSIRSVRVSEPYLNLHPVSISLCHSRSLRIWNNQGAVISLTCCIVIGGRRRLLILYFFFSSPVW